MLQQHLDALIATLLSWRSDKKIEIPEQNLNAMLSDAREVLMSEPMLLELHGPLNVLGDIHGQYSELLRFFQTSGYPPTKDYLFLGDYVDRGMHSVETLALVLAYKVKFPKSIHLLRGNHEAAVINHHYGFYDECKRRFTIRLWKMFVDCYNCLPVAAVIGQKIFCCHGGLSPLLHEMDEIRKIERPAEIQATGLLTDLLWSDPDPNVTGWGVNNRGVSVTFGPDIVYQFLQRHKFDLICRGHQVVEDGYEFFAKRQLITIFSAVNYCGEYDNAGGMMCVDKDLNITLLVLKPKALSKKKKK